MNKQMMRKTGVWWMLLPGILGNVSWAQDNSALITDRPDFTESPFTVQPDRMQLEMGYTYRESDNGNEVRTQNFPEVLLRIGWVENWELRLGWGGYSFEENGEDIANDMRVGAKWAISDQDGWHPQLALLGEITIPTGHGDNDVDPTITLAWSYDLNDKNSVGGNLGIGSVTQDGDRFAQGSASIAWNHTLDDQWGFYTEYYTTFPDADDEDAVHIIDGGLVYLINDDLQLDFSLGFGLNEQADDLIVGFGFSHRF